MNNIESLEDTARRLLNPNKTFSPLVFDNKDVMFEDLRQKFIAIATSIFEETANHLEGVKIEDILLIGSMAGYNYTERSDYDIAIKLNFDDCPFLKFKDKTARIKFLIFLYANALNRLPEFNINGKLVDISFKAETFLDSYSILHNKWLVKSEREIHHDKIVNELVSEYYRSIEHYALFMQEFNTINGKYSVEDYNKMLDYYLGLVIFNNNYNWDNHLIYKLLIKHDVINKIGQNITNSLKYTLSLY